MYEKHRNLNVDNFEWDRIDEHLKAGQDVFAKTASQKEWEILANELERLEKHASDAVLKHRVYCTATDDFIQLQGCTAELVQKYSDSKYGSHWNGLDLDKAWVHSGLNFDALDKALMQLNKVPAAPQDSFLESKVYPKDKITQLRDEGKLLIKLRRVLEKCHFSSAEEWTHLLSESGGVLQEAGMPKAAATSDEVRWAWIEALSFCVVHQSDGAPGPPHRAKIPGTVLEEVEKKHLEIVKSRPLRGAEIALINYARTGVLEGGGGGGCCGGGGGWPKQLAEKAMLPGPDPADLAPARDPTQKRPSVGQKAEVSVPTPKRKSESGKEWVKGMGPVPDLTNPPPIEQNMSNVIQDELNKRLDQKWDTFYPEVAISYATAMRSEDAKGAGPGMAMAAAVLHALADEGIPCSSGLHVPPSSNWKTFLQKIDSRYSNCKVLIVLVSEALLISIPCLTEIRKAMAAGVKIVKLRVPEDGPFLDKQWPKATHGEREEVRDFGSLNCLPPRGSFFAPKVIDSELKKLILNLKTGKYNGPAIKEYFHCYPRLHDPPETPPPPQCGRQTVPDAPPLLPEEEPMDWEKPRLVSSTLMERVCESVRATVCKQQVWGSMQPEVLICYAPQKRPNDFRSSNEAGAGLVMAAALTHRLAEHGVKAASRLCMGAGDTNESYLDKIRADTSQCRVMLVLLTSELYTSERCFNELSEAMKKDAQLVPLRVEDDKTLLKGHDRWANGLLKKGQTALQTDLLLEVENVLDMIDNAATFPKATAETFFSIAKIEGSNQTAVEKNIANLADHVKIKVKEVEQKVKAKAAEKAERKAKQDKEKDLVTEKISALLSTEAKNVDLGDLRKAIAEGKKLKLDAKLIRDAEELAIKAEQEDQMAEQSQSQPRGKEGTKKGRAGLTARGKKPPKEVKV